MGSILRPPAAAGPWGLEISGDHSAIHLPHDHEPLTATRGEGRISVDIPLALIPALVVALDVLLAQFDVIVTEPHADAWQVEGAGEHVTVRGPGHLYLIGQGGNLAATTGRTRMIEVEHIHLATLREALAEVVAMSTPTRLQRKLAEKRTWLAGLDLAAIASPEHDDVTDLELVRDAILRKHSGDIELARAIRVARGRGRTWTQIAALLGVTRQAAQEKYGDG